MERRVLIVDAPVVRRSLAETPAQGVALPIQGELDLDGDAWARVQAAFEVNLDGISGWAWDRVIYDRTRAFSVAKELPMRMLLPGVVIFSEWSKEPPPSRGWWLVREQPGGEMSVLWFERFGRLDGGSWHQGVKGGESIAYLGQHNELTNIEWCGLAEPWADDYEYMLDGAGMDSAARAARNAPVQRRQLLELQ
ncbi:hypothetical protein D3C87_1018410 [compost metagenome]